MNYKVAVREYFGNAKTGERETVRRIGAALSNLGICVVYSEAGTESERDLLHQEEILFLLDLHFAVPRATTVFSVGALWNPLDYYSLWGGSIPLESQFSHDMFVAANVELATRQLALLRPDNPAEILPLNHSVSRETLVPFNKNALAEIFYVGIGWDRSSKGGHRNDKVLRLLDSRNLISIYGPEKLADGTRPWKGFGDSYKGEIAFDGFSIFREINKYAFVLALSSDSHKKWGIQSNRIFEGIAGGAIPIVEEGVKTGFDEENIIRLNRLTSPEETIDELMSEIGELNENNDLRASHVSGLQERLLNDFALEAQLLKIVERVAFLKRDQKGFEISGGRSSEKSAWFADIDLVDYWDKPLEGLSVSDSSSLSPEILLRLRDCSSEYVRFKFSDSIVESPILIQNSGSLGFDVFHINSQWRHSGQHVFGPVKAVNPGERFSDGLIIRRSLAIEWFVKSGCLVSVGALLLSFAEDFRHPQPTFRHCFLNLTCIIQQVKTPTTLVSLVSSLDIIGCTALARIGPGPMSELAERFLNASGTPTNIVNAGSFGLLTQLKRELAAVGYVKALRMVISEVFSLRRKG